MQQPEHFQPLPCPGRLCVIAEPLNLFCLFLTQLDDDRHSWLPENSPLRTPNPKENYPQPNPKNQESANSRYSIAGIIIGIRYESKLYFLICSGCAFAAVVFSCVIYMAVGYAMSS